MESADSNDKLFYTLIKKQRQNVNENVQTLKVNVKEVNGSEKLLEAWKDHFKILATPEDRDFQENDKVNLALEQNNIIENRIKNGRKTLENTDNSELQKAIESLNIGKAVDENGISSEHFKYAKSEVTPILVDTVNDIFNNLDVPNAMKCGILNPIHKKERTNFLQITTEEKSYQIHLLKY
ncbi:hypothetical protein DPMN_107750 [Dreissena polymorpha]|uniref:Uncharacterized protein n=1 Tax=Dreissena polymorpha TaxID=45954 RepID=A0A9D4K796_DREPO|nr:hypothetical protein DPMN_107750 [Dreissena polymorpha]